MIVKRKGWSALPALLIASARLERTATATVRRPTLRRGECGQNPGQTEPRANDTGRCSGGVPAQIAAAAVAGNDQPVGRGAYACPKDITPRKAIVSGSSAVVTTLGRIAARLVPGSTKFRSVAGMSVAILSAIGSRALLATHVDRSIVIGEVLVRPDRGTVIVQVDIER